MGTELTKNIACLFRLVNSEEVHIEITSYQCGVILFAKFGDEGLNSKSKFLKAFFAIALPWRPIYVSYNYLVIHQWM